MSPITDLQGVGDAATGYEGVGTVTSGGQTIDLYIDLLAIRVGRAVVDFEFTNPGQRTSQGPDIVNAVINRVASLSTQEARTSCSRVDVAVGRYIGWKGVKRRTGCPTSLAFSSRSAHRGVRR